MKNREDNVSMTRHTGPVEIHEIEAKKRPIQLRIVIPDGWVMPEPSYRPGERCACTN